MCFVFREILDYWVIDNVYCSLIIYHNKWQLEQYCLIENHAASRWANIWASHVASIIYLASDEDLDTVVYFLLFQETGDVPNRKPKPVIVLQVSWQAPKWEFENSFNLLSVFAEKNLKTCCWRVLYISEYPASCSMVIYELTKLTNIKADIIDELWHAW